MAEWNWYLSIRAVREYMQIVGLRGELEDDNPDFLRAQEELGALSQNARLVRPEPDDHGALVYRANIAVRGKQTRIELTVVPRPRAEGSLPQLVRVRTKPK